MKKEGSNTSSTLSAAGAGYSTPPKSPMLAGLARGERLSPGAAAWVVEAASLNTARGDHGAAAVGNVIFVVGGADASPEFPTRQEGRPLDRAPGR